MTKFTSSDIILQRGNYDKDERDQTTPMVLLFLSKKDTCGI